MSFTNFAALQSLTSVGNSDQFLVSLNNGLSGAAGFGRATTAALTANWTQTLSFNASNAQLSISSGNTISLSSLSAASVFTGTVSAATFVTSVSSTAAANYRFTLSNANKTTIDTFSNNTYYGVPNNAAVAFPTGSQLVVVQGNKSASNYTVLSAGAGVTINSFNNSLSLAGNYAAGTLIKTDTNVWYLIGNLK